MIENKLHEENSVGYPRLTFAMGVQHSSSFIYSCYYLDKHFIGLLAIYCAYLMNQNHQKYYRYLSLHVTCTLSIEVLCNGLCSWDSARMVSQHLTTSNYSTTNIHSDKSDNAYLFYTHRITVIIITRKQIWVGCYTWLDTALSALLRVYITSLLVVLNALTLQLK